MATQSRTAPASGPPYYLWEVAGKPISIQLSFDAMDRVYPEIMRGLGALKRRGAEVGGILLGHLEPDSPGNIIIEDFEPVPSEYLTGPSYNLSANDRVAFEAAIARRRSQAAAGGPSVVGFYRSHTRDELYLDDADMALAQDYFPDANNVFLLIKPFATRTSIGGFFFWENGEINRQSSYLQFPFHRGELGGGEPRPQPRPAPVPVWQETERPLPPYTPAAELRRQQADLKPEQLPFSPAARTNLSILSEPPNAPARSWMPVLRWLLLAFLAVACAAGFIAYREMAAPKPPAINVAEAETTLPLKLSVSEKQNQLDVTWDRNAPAIAQATRGILSISDGVHKKDLELTGPQLRTGRVLYSRLSGDVGLRLEVFSDKPGSVAESIRIVSTEPPAREPAPEPPVTQEAPAKQPKPVAAPPEVVVERPKNIARPTPPKPAAQSDPPPEATPAPELELQRPARR